MISIRDLTGQGWSGGVPDTLDHKERDRGLEPDEIGDQSPVVKAVKGNRLHIVCAYTLCRLLYYSTYRGFALTTLTTGVRGWKSASLAVEVVR